MSTIEDLKRDKRVNDEEIAGLKKDIKDYDDRIKRGEKLEPEQKEQLAAWRARLSELTDQNTTLNQQITELSKPSVPQGFQEAFLALAGNWASQKRKRLWDDDGQQSHRSQGVQRQFKEDVVAYYDRGDGKDHAWCMLLNEKLSLVELTAAHIFPYKHRGIIGNYGGSPSDIMSPRNGLVLCERVEKAFDDQRVCFLWDPIAFHFFFYVLDNHLYNQKVCDDPRYTKTFKDLHGAHLCLPLLPAGAQLKKEHPLFGKKPPASGRYPAVIPFRRFLQMHAHDAFEKAKSWNWISSSQLKDFKEMPKEDLSDEYEDEHTSKDKLTRYLQGLGPSRSQSSVSIQSGGSSQEGGSSQGGGSK